MLCLLLARVSALIQYYTLFRNALNPTLHGKECCVALRNLIEQDVVDEEKKPFDASALMEFEFLDEGVVKEGEEGGEREEEATAFTAAAAEEEAVEIDWSAMMTAGVEGEEDTTTDNDAVATTGIVWDIGTVEEEVVEVVVAPLATAEERAAVVSNLEELEWYVGLA
jgi:hypothetical protein